jgi:hypothetical protein
LKKNLEAVTKVQIDTREALSRNTNVSMLLAANDVTASFRQGFQVLLIEPLNNQNTLAWSGHALIGGIVTQQSLGNLALLTFCFALTTVTSKQDYDLVISDGRVMSGLQGVQERKGMATRRQPVHPIR